MQEIKKRRIVIASVLKPVDDTRMYEKLGQTLASQHEVHIIGFHANTIPVNGIHLHSIGSFSRLSFSRLRKRYSIFQKVISLKPDVLIICTHELLWHGVFLRMFGIPRLWYDVQENYYKNIQYTNAFPTVLRPFIASLVRFKEWLCAPAVEHFLLAEQVYMDEIPFTRKRAIVLENKVWRGDVKKIGDKKRGRKLLFSGTLAESTGVFIAIHVASVLYEIDRSIRLTIIGFCSRENELDLLKRTISDKPFVTLVGGDALVPHAEILAQIINSDFGIISYPPNHATENRTPTKLFEYLGSRLPILLINNPHWVAYARHFNASIVFDPASFDAASILSRMESEAFYSTDPQNVYWESQQARLLHLV